MRLRGETQNKGLGRREERTKDLILPKRGKLRQGAWMIGSKGRRKPYKIRHFLAHILYADDVFIFCRADACSLRCLAGFLAKYSNASGQHINKAKSTFYLGKHSANRKHAVEDLMGFRESVIPFHYLGVLRES